MSSKKKVTRGNPANGGNKAGKAGNGNKTNSVNGAGKPKSGSSTASNWKPSGSIGGNSNSVSNSKKVNHKPRRSKPRWKKIFVLVLIIGMALSLFGALLVGTPNIVEPIAPYNAPDVGTIAVSP